MPWVRWPIRFVDWWSSDIERPVMVVKRIYVGDFIELASLVESLRNIEGWDYYWAERMTRVIVDTIASLVEELKEDGRLAEEIVRLQRIRIQPYLWSSKRNAVLNPLYVFQKMAPLAVTLKDEFIDTFIDVYRYLSQNLYNMLEEDTRRLEEADICRRGGGSSWCEESLYNVKAKIDALLEKMVSETGEAELESTRTKMLASVSE